MKILWITFVTFPEAKSLILKESDYRISGGWILGLANSLVYNKDVNLVVASISPLVKELTYLEGEHISYYMVPYGAGYLKYNREYESYWRKITNKEKPDVVHIHGSEYCHGLTYLNACPDMKDKVVLSIQGMPSVISSYYKSNLSEREIRHAVSIRDILRLDTISHAKKAFQQRGEKFEIPLIKGIRHVIGRTSWDKVHTWAINPDAQYHFCNEILRSEFYEGDCWSYDTCKKHTIFISQAGYPIKGFHQVLKAMPLILRHYPDTQIRIAGHDITYTKGVRNLLRLSGYGRIIKSLIKKYHLSEYITFTGALNAEEMKQEYLNANVFICPSSIENSPNSLGEAQILGVPCIASYVGGIMDMIPNADCGTMYRFEDVEMLAHAVVNVFDKSPDFDNAAMRYEAARRHDRNVNVKTMIEIYNKIR